MSFPTQNNMRFPIMVSSMGTVCMVFIVLWVTKRADPLWSVHVKLWALVLQYMPCSAFSLYIHSCISQFWVLIQLLLQLLLQLPLQLGSRHL